MFGTVHKLPSGRYRAMYYGTDGRRYSAPSTFITEKDARGFLALRQAEIIQRTWLPPGTGDKPQAKLTLKTYTERWLRQRDLRSRTREEYRNLLEKQILPRLGELPIASITPDDIRDWYAKLNPKTPTLRSHAYSLLRTILRTALTDGKTHINPCTIRGAGSTKRAHQVQAASVEELAVIIEEMPDRYRAMILIGAWCALRFGEVTELRRQDVQITEGSGVLRIRRGVTRTKDGPEVGPPKTQAGVRDVAIPPHILGAIADHLAVHTGSGANALLFPAVTNPEKHLAGSTFKRHYFPARAKARRDDLHFHDLRHTGAVFAALPTGGDATLSELMQRLGHSTPAAAMNYQSVAKGRAQTVAEKMSRLAGGQ